MLPLPNFAKVLAALRKEKKLTQNDLANYLNISRAAYTNYELGKCEPDFNTLRKLAKYFNVTTDFLLELHEDNLNTFHQTNTNIPDEDKEAIEIAAKYKKLPLEIQQAVKTVINIADAGFDAKKVSHK